MRVGFYLVPGFLYSPAALLLLLLLLFGGPPGEGARHLDMFFAGYLRLLSAPSSRVYTATITGYFSPSSPPLSLSLPSLRSLHSCTNNMENPGERRKTTEEMGQGRAVSSPPLLQINNIAGKARESGEKHRQTVAGAGFGAWKRIPERS